MLELEEMVSHGPNEKVWAGDTVAVQEYVAACISVAKSDDWFYEDQQAAQALLTFCDAFLYIADEEYLWYRFLREQIGMALITPEDIAYVVSPPQHATRKRPMKRYYKQFREWMYNLGPHNDKLVHDWYVRPGDKVLLVETEIVLGTCSDDHTSKRYAKGHCNLEIPSQRLSE